MPASWRAPATARAHTTARRHPRRVACPSSSLPALRVQPLALRFQPPALRFQVLPSASSLLPSASRPLPSASRPAHRAQRPPCPARASSPPRSPYLAYPRAGQEWKRRNHKHRGSRNCTYHKPDLAEYPRPAPLPRAPRPLKALCHHLITIRLQAIPSAAARGPPPAVRGGGHRPAADLPPGRPPPRHTSLFRCLCMRSDHFCAGFVPICRAELIQRAPRRTNTVVSGPPTAPDPAPAANVSPSGNAVPASPGLRRHLLAYAEDPCPPDSSESR